MELKNDHSASFLIILIIVAIFQFALMVIKMIGFSQDDILAYAAGYLICSVAALVSQRMSTISGLLIAGVIIASIGGHASRLDSIVVGYFVAGVSIAICTVVSKASSGSKDGKKQ